MKTRILTAFVGDNFLANGPDAVIRDAIRALEAGGVTAPVLAFDDSNGRQSDVDMRASPATATPAAAPAEPARRGRPKLGVIPKEITLLPRHWDWLGQQKGGASVALRKLVEAAMRDDSGPAERARARDAAYHFLSAKAGDYPHFEDAIRALYADDQAGFESAMTGWPDAVQSYALRLSAGTWEGAA